MYLFEAVKIVKDEVRKRSKGYAFIQYSSQEAALQALENMDRKVVLFCIHFIHVSRF